MGKIVEVGNAEKVVKITVDKLLLVRDSTIDSEIGKKPYSRRSPFAMGVEVQEVNRGNQVLNREQCKRRVGLVGGISPYCNLKGLEASG